MMERMAIIYTDLVVKDAKKFTEVPPNLQDNVKQKLIERGYPELAE